MTTTSSTTSSTGSITNALGAGSGIDIGSLVQSLVDNSFSLKNQQLSSQSDKLTAQISGLAKIKSGITGFDSALKSLVKGGTLATQPTSSNTSVVTATALSGAKLNALSAQLVVDTLASAQAATTATAVPRTTGFPAGTLAITSGAASKTLTIPQDATLDGIAAQINAESSLGLTATVVTDGTGARLSIKGKSGAANAFTIAATDNGAPTSGTASLQQLSVNSGTGGMQVGTPARDAIVYLDGAKFTRPTNSIGDLITGVRLDLQTTSANPVTIGNTPPTAALSQAVSDFVETYNQMLGVIKEQDDASTGPLKNETLLTALQRNLSQLTTTSLAANGSGAPTTLADLGVKTNRDGTLAVDTTVLTKVLASNPQAVEAMFADGAGASNGGLSAALSAVVAKATATTTGLDAISDRYTKAQKALSTTQSNQTDAAAAMKTRLTQQFAAMDAKVAAYKSTQTFLENQIKAWNQSSN